MKTDLATALLEHMLVTIADAEGKFLFASERFCALSQYAPVELLGQDFRFVLSDRHAEEFFQSIGQAVASGRTWKRETEIRAKDGSRHWVDATIVPIPDASGRPRSYVTFHTAVPDVVRLVEQERHYADAVLDGLPGVFYHYDDTPSLRRWNKNLERISGYSSEELSGIDPLTFFAEADRERISSKIAEVFASGESQVEANFLLKDGRQVPCLFTGIRFEHEGRRGFVGLGTDLTKQKNVEAELRQSLARFHAVARATGDAVWDWDLTTNASWRNENYRILFGDPSGELEPVISSWEERIHPEDRQRVVTHIHAIIDGTDETWFDEYRFRRGDGSYADVFDRGYVLRDASGRGVRMVGAIQDITERKRAEADVREMLARFHAAARATGDVIWDWDLTTNDIWWNENFTLLFGYPKEEIEPSIESWTRRIHPEDRERVVAHIRSIIAGTEEVWFDEYRFLRKDGSYAELFDRGHVLRNASGRGVRMVGAMQDITERKHKAEALRREMDERRRVEEILHLAMRVKKMGAWSRDFESEAAWSSPSALALFGADEPGRGDANPNVGIEALARIAHPEDRRYVEQVLAQQSGTEHDFDFETRVIRQGGQEGHLHVRSEVFRSSDGTPLRRIGIVEDITALKHAQIENQALDQRLRQAQKMEAIGTFAAGIAHDFNNILAVIHMSADLIAEDEAYAESVQDILHAAARARDLVDQILGFAKQRLAPREPLDLRQPVSEALRLLQGSLTPGIALERDLPEAAAMVSGNATQLLRLVLNLGKNAIQAMSEQTTAGQTTADRRTGRLRVGLERRTVDSHFALSHPPLRPGSALVLEVQDSGPGMDAATVARIFEPFFSTKGVGGTGLGLALVHGIVAQHQGTIIVDSTPGVGTTFSVWLPVLEESSVGTESLPPPSHRGRRILVVDHEPRAAAATVELLNQFGYATEALEDSVVARERIAKNPALFDLVIADARLPGLDGLGLAQSAWLSRPNLPFIILGDSRSLVIPARTTGFETFLAKPCTPEALGDACAAAFSRR